MATQADNQIERQFALLTLEEQLILLERLTRQCRLGATHGHSFSVPIQVLPADVERPHRWTATNPIRPEQTC